MLDFVLEFLFALLCIAMIGSAIWLGGWFVKRAWHRRDGRHRH